MENDYKSFIHDTINLDEIRLLLGDALGPVEEEASVLSMLQQSVSEEPAAEETEPEEAAVPEEQVMEEETSQVLPVWEDTVEETVTEEPLDPVLTAETMVIPVMEPETAENGEAEEPSAADPVPAAEEAVLPEEPEVEQFADSMEDAGQEAKKQKKTRKKQAAVHELYYLLHDVVYLLAAVTLVFVFFVRLVGVKGDSMYPTLWDQDFLILESNFLYRGDDLKYGDVVVLNVPYYEERNEGPIVKRVIATEGQTVQIDFESGAVYVDGVMLSETYINEPTTYNWDGELGLQYPAVVPENCIFVLGDNRNNSMDSRYASIGMIDERCVLGKVLLIALPGQVTDDLGNVVMPRDWGRIGLVS